MSETIPPEEPANQHPATAAMNLFIGAVAALESLDTDELVRGDWRLADATRESLVKAADRLEGFRQRFAESDTANAADAAGLFGLSPRSPYSKLRQNTYGAHDSGNGSPAPEI